MPAVSVIVIAYNVADVIGRCIASLRAQTADAFEVIIVDDASTDGTLAVINEAVAGDKRFKVVRHASNRGPHHARRTGLEHARGGYTLFLDGDDEFAPSFIADVLARMEEHPADMLHFGITVKAEGEVTEEQRASFEAYINATDATATGEDVARDIFDVSHGQAVDWRTVQRLYRTEFLQEAFAQMTDARLYRTEDAHEVFVLALLAKSCTGAEDIRGLIYHYGGGITGASAISAERFATSCTQFRTCVEATRDFVSNHPEIASGNDCLFGMQAKLYELLANDWQLRVPDAEKPAAFEALVREQGPVVAAREAWRFVRDRAWDLLQQETAPTDDDTLYLYEKAARSVAYEGGHDRWALRLAATRDAAEAHLADVELLKRRAAYDGQPIRIFVTTHLNAEVPNSRYLQPVQVGPGVRSGRFPFAFHDNDGENISDKNPMYCELTTQYWAWKNVDAQYVGFCHYRRYFNFSEHHFKENAYGEIMDERIDAAAAERYGLNDETIRRCVTGYDVITTGFHDLRGFAGDYSTLRQQYEAAPLLHIEDLNRMAAIAKRLYPDYARDVDEFLDGHTACFCNMYIMRQDIFHAYCAWLFPILETFCDEADMSHYSREALRTPGHLGERLFNIYYRHAMRTGAGWKTKQLQCVHFADPGRSWPLAAVLRERPDAQQYASTVPVVFAADDGYVPMLTTTIHSMLTNASPDRFYDVVVLTHDISARHQEQIRSFMKRHANANVRFFDVTRMVAGHHLVTNNAHISVETYYRFLVQDIMAGYDRVLYLDSDLIVEGDVARLYDVDLGDKLLAAAHDIDYLANLNDNDGRRLAYSKKTLHMQDPYGYFQAGVLVLNIAQMRKLHSVEEWLQIVSGSKYLYDDQDVLNATCQGRVVYLPFSWNVMHDNDGRVEKLFPKAPAAEFGAYQASRKDPQIIHFAGWEKPWVNPDCDFAPHYWRYARETPYYEDLVARLGGGTGTLRPKQVQHEKAVPENSPLRHLVDPLAPYGSQRREVLKAIGRAVQGKK